MAEQTVELRGIPLSHLITYLAECGGVPLGDTLPITVRGERWQAELLREETIPLRCKPCLSAFRLTIRERSTDCGNAFGSRFSGLAVDRPETAGEKER
ncbi:hypothetical protein M4D70_05225 [Brevibacillus borstelensis]|uniref:hypothetical protein n=1 Tax=Brevibacillus borstelensis TaxID=45462 RepID=UPI00204243CB|nr:hypothetical protein [Brevibacillus borstelensis]MCM3621662.1 hypothetical protein [Brevibacillus borstelensis]